MSHLDSIRAEALSVVEKSSSLGELEQLRIAYLGKKGKITEQFKQMGGLDAEQKKAFGAQLNIIKDTVTQAIQTRQDVLNAEAINARLASEKVDITLPVRPERFGKVHPITQVTQEIIAIFADLGFEVKEGSAIEDDFHNFTALNIPESHPARQMHDTFYLHGDGQIGKTLLRTHTSPVQIRTMREGKPPFRFIAPGTTYRCDSDPTHTPMFHQVEGVVIDKNIHMGHLKGCIEAFVRAFFEMDIVPVRFRPSFFPFTEPSAEVDIGCSRANGELKIGTGKDWLEIIGCGMVHPNVLRNCGIDPNEWQGFAFGMGIDRVAMLKYGIPDLRTFFESDIRWLNHYGFDALDIPSLIGGLSQ